MGEFVGAAEVAKLLGISERTVRHRAADGTLAGAFRVGKLWRIHMPTLRAALDAAMSAGEGRRAPPPVGRTAARSEYDRRAAEIGRDLRRIRAQIDRDGRMTEFDRSMIAGEVYHARREAAERPAGWRESPTAWKRPRLKDPSRPEAEVERELKRIAGQVDPTGAMTDNERRKLVAKVYWARHTPATTLPHPSRRHARVRA